MTFLVSRFQRAMVWLALSGVGAIALEAQVTEVPQTVAPGKFLVEIDGVKLDVDREDGAGNEIDVLGVGGVLVSTGLMADLDVQVGVQLFHRETIEMNGRRESDSGLGDVTVRTKWTFWRDEDWGAAAAVIPYVKLPNNNGVGNGNLEGGFIVPWSMDLGGGFVPGAMFAWDMVRNDANDGYDARWSVSGYVERPLLLGITGYAEAILETASTGTSDSAGQVGVGARWRVAGVELDYEVLKGLNARASAWTQVIRVNWGW